MFLQSYYNIDIKKPWENDRFLLLTKKSYNELNNLIQIWESNIIKLKEERTKPRIDDKIIVSWNSLAISV